MPDRLADPGDAVLDGQRVVVQRGGALRTADDEQVGKAVEAHSGVGLRAVRPLLVQRHAIAAHDVHRQQWTGEGVEARSQDDHVEVVLGLGSLDPACGEALDRCGADVDEFDLSRLYAS